MPSLSSGSLSIFYLYRFKFIIIITEHLGPRECWLVELLNFQSSKEHSNKCFLTWLIRVKGENKCASLSWCLEHSKDAIIANNIYSY